MYECESTLWPPALFTSGKRTETVLCLFFNLFVRTGESIRKIASDLFPSFPYFNLFAFDTSKSFCVENDV